MLDMKKLLYILLGLIIVLAFFLRFYKVTEIPPSLNWDEVSIGYNAYSILKTGRDEWNQLLPLHFKAYGEYKLPVQIYASVPGIAIFGLNELGVRITPVLYGTLTVLVAFFLGSLIFKSPWVGLIASFLLAISPWHIHLTRASFEASFATFWIALSILFLIKGFEKSKYFYISAVTFAIAIYTYNSARAFVPIFLSVIFLSYFKEIRKNLSKAFIAFAIFVILLLPLLPFVLNGEANARYKLVSITDDPGLIPRINENRGNSDLPNPLPRLIHNKVTYISFYFVRNYISHFSPIYLFISGAPHKQHHVQGIGQLYLFEAPFLIIGLFLLFKQRHKYRFLLLSWILIAFIPVSITNDSIPHALRTVIVLPSYQLITAFGLFSVLQKLRQSQTLLTFVSIVLMFVVLSSVGYYLYRYYFIYPQDYSKDWQYGYQQALDFVNKEAGKYNQIVFTRHYGEPHMFTLFFLNYDPYKFQNDPNLDRFETFDWVRVLKFNNFYFPDLGDKGTQYSDIKNGEIKQLFIGKEGDFPPEIPRLKVIKFLDGKTAFEIVGQ